MAKEPCAGCDRETAVGSALFTTRRRAIHRTTGDTAFVCAACVADRAARGEAYSESRLGAFELADIFNTR